ncbi:MAG: efflux RND transporter periplasmic adaptor subunit [Nitratireductor sp.]
MRFIRSYVLLALAIGAGLIGGYRSGAGVWPGVELLPDAATGLSAPPISDRTQVILYWRHPDGRPEWSATPVKTVDGRDFVPVKDHEEPDFPDNMRATPSAESAVSGRKILYYRNPMGLPDTSPEPKKDWMGMDYIPVYEGEEEDDGTVTVSVAKMQRSGVRAEPAAMRQLVRPIRAPGVAKPDERTLLTIALRADGFIEKLYVNETGRHVKKGEPLFRVYSPDMVRVQVDYRISVNASGNRDDEGALQRLQNLQLPNAVVKELKRTRKPVISFNWPSPASGVVMQKMAVEGMMMKAGDEIMRLADLTSIWVVADVNEQDIGQIRIGSKAQVRFRAFPGETFEGVVTFVLHELEMATRTAKVRVEVANPDHRIKHEMFADVEINAVDHAADRLSVPVSALIDSGNRQVVIVDRGEGRFEPRPVQVGLRGDDYVEITNGLKVGENVVVTANFLIDAESNLKAALAGFVADAPNPAPPAAATDEK